MSYYHDLYLKCDVLLLADVFEKFDLKNYGLCPSHYFSAPVDLELIPDPETDLFFEKSTRGGVSYISDRYSKRNNKHLIPYDPKQESKHTIFFDANDLYGYAISKFLPTSGFKWKILKSLT